MAIIIPQQPGRTKADTAKKAEFAKVMTEEIEKIARAEAAKNGSDISKESNGLMRAIMHVMARPELVEAASAAARKRLEASGVFPTENTAVVKHKPVHRPVQRR